MGPKIIADSTSDSRINEKKDEVPKPHMVENITGEDTVVSE